ncbi:hypothetical protein ID866_8205 [Astraeus odoratus]|nr:hypothetical protein ID866_8205 [Astraeus odoratus]
MPTQHQSFTNPPPISSHELKVSFPEEHVLQLTINRPQQRNAVTPTLSREIGNVLAWFDDEPSLWYVRCNLRSPCGYTHGIRRFVSNNVRGVALKLIVLVVIVTGEGDMFCAGADLKIWHEKQSSGRITEQEDAATSLHGFASISRRRTSLKPMIAAVNGPAYGGGVEIILNCDLVVASRDAVFALPEVKRGVLAAQGVIPRLSRVAGHQVASEMLLLGSPITAIEARDRYRFVNAVVDPVSVLPTALAYARILISNSPDSVQSSKEGLLLAQQAQVEEAVQMHALSHASRRLWRGTNVKEGLAAFKEVCTLCSPLSGDIVIDWPTQL